MARIDIPLNSGIDNFSDGEEVGAKGNLELENVYISTPGKITLRPYTTDLITLNNINIHKIRRWANPDLPFSGFGWVAVITDHDYNTENNLDSNTKRLVVYNRDFTQIQVIGELESGAVPRKIEILENVVLFTMGVGEDSLRYRYYDSQFFDGMHTIQKWFLDTGRPINNFVSLKSVSSVGDGGYLEDGKYFFYKVVPVFDGLQISPLPQHYQFATSTVENDKMLLEIEVDLDSMNPRCSSIDIYRAEGLTELEEDLNYYKVKSISMYAPMEQTGAIQDNSNVGQTIADNLSMYDGDVGEDFSTTNRMIMLTPHEASETTSERLTDANTQKCSQVRLFNQQSGTTEYSTTRKNSNVADYQHATGDSSNDLDAEDIHWYDNQTYETQSSYGKDVYPIKGVSHTQTTTNDNATDTLHTHTIRQTDHYSEGDKSWLVLKRDNIISNGHFMRSWGASQWNTSVAYSQEQNVPNNAQGDPSWISSDSYRGQGGYGTGITSYERPQMVFTPWLAGGLTHGSAYSNSDGSVANNQFLQTVTLEAGKKYWIQYAYQWLKGNTGSDHQKKQWAYIKFTKPNGAHWNGNNHNWQSKDNTDGVFFHDYGYYTPTGHHWHSGSNWGSWEKSWWKYGTVYDCQDAGDHTFNIWFHCDVTYWGSSMKTVMQIMRWKDVGIFELQERNNYYAGNQVIQPNAYKNYNEDDGNPLTNDNDYSGGNIFVDDVKYPLETNKNTIFTLSQNIPVLGGVKNILLTKGVSASTGLGEDGNMKMNIEVNDIGHSSVMKHPTHEVPINVKYEFSQYIEGRMYVANCRYTNEQYDDVEQDANLVLFSELNQPNIIPVTNYIKVQDNQGGNITGLGELMGNLLVFLEDSIWRINIPTTDPNNWSLVESSKELGCTSKKSIMSYEDGVFFANKEGLWGLSQNFMPKEISKPWRDHYQDNYDEETIVHYCPKSHMLYVNQNNPYETWVLDINNDNQTTNWLKLVQKQGNGAEMSGWSGFMNDETSKPFFFENRGDNCVIGDLEARSGNNKLGFRKKTGWIRLGNLETRHMVRRINFRYKNKFEDKDLVPDVNIYIDGSENVAYTKRGDDIFNIRTGEEAVASIRCGVRCRYFSIELNRTLTGDIISDEKDLFEVLTMDVEWE